MRCIRCNGALDGVTARQCPACGQPFNPDDPETYEHDARRPGKRQEKKDGAPSQPARAQRAQPLRATSASSTGGKIDAFWLWTASGAIVYVVIAIAAMALFAGQAASSAGTGGAGGTGGAWTLGRFVWKIVGFPLMTGVPSTIGLGVWARLLINSVFWGFTLACARKAYVEKMKGPALHDHDDPDEM